MTVLLSYILILIEESLPLNCILMIVFLPFISFVAARKKWGLIHIFLISVLEALQTDKFFSIFFVTMILYFIFLNIYKIFNYELINILIFVLLQIIAYILINHKNLSVHCIIINVIGFLIFNYVYITLNSKNKLDN